MQVCSLKEIDELEYVVPFARITRLYLYYICDNVGNVSPQRSYDRAFPLHLATYRGQIGIAKLLIGYELDDAWTCLKIAFCAFTVWVVIFLNLTLNVNSFGDDELMQRCIHYSKYCL